VNYKDIPSYCDYHEFYRNAFNALPDGAVMAEVGVYLGHSVVFMAELAKESGKNITIYAVDTFEGSEEHKRKGITNFLEQYKRNVKPYEKYVVTCIGKSTEVAKTLKVNFDFVFLDAAHDYESVKADIEAWGPKAKILAGHDYNKMWPGVVKAVDELVPDRILTSKSVWLSNVW